MSDDFVLTVNQIMQYPQLATAAPTDGLLIQQNGVGGAYNFIAPTDLISSALSGGGFINFAIDGGLSWPNGHGIVFSGASFVCSDDLQVPSLHSVGDIFVNGVALADQIEVTQLFDSIVENSVWTFNGRKGNVQLSTDDILRAGGIAQNNPHFTGTVLAPTFWDFRDSSDRVATTAWVQGVIGALLCSGSIVTSFDGRGGDVILTADDISQAATFPGAMPRANNPPLGDASTRIATTMFVDDTVFDMENRLTILIDNQTDFALAAYAPLASPAFTGMPTAPTAAPGSTTGQLATTAFVMNAVAASTAGVSSFNARTGAVTLTTADITGAGGAPINSPTLTGAPQAPTATTATNTQQIATTAFVHAVLTATGMVSSFNTRTGAVSLTTADITGAGGAPSASPALSGTPTAPTAVTGTNTTQIATTAFVLAELGTISGAVTSWNGRTGAVTLQANDISAAGGALLASPSFSGVPLAPTAAPGTATTQLATTAFVMANAGVGGVSSFNGRQGAITLLTADVTGAGGAPISSPAFTGTPTAPTPAQTVNDQTLATTAYVRAAVAAATGVASFNARTGVVTLLLSDVTSAGGAPLASPIFTGNPQAPTASPGNATTSLATTAFVTAAISAAVVSFNGRTGAITLIGGDITGAGGALLASPTFTGTPNAPTPTTGTNNTQIATTAFVNAAISAAGGVTYKQADTPPLPLTNFWFDSLNGQLYVNYVDPSTSAQSWVIANSFTPPPPQPLAAGTRVLLQSTIVATPVASVSFFYNFTNAYDKYELEFYDVQVSGAGTLGMRISLDGTTFDASANYNIGYVWWQNAGAGNWVNTTTATSAQLTSSMGTLATVTGWGKAEFDMPWTTDRYKIWAARSFVNSGTSFAGLDLIASWTTNTNPWKGFQVLPAAGNITRGVFNLYGIVKAGAGGS